MIGIVIVTHGQLGREMLKTAELIVGSLDTCRAVSLESDLGPDSMRQAVGQAIDAADQGRGVLVLTDMFGGTPSNISLSFLDKNRVEVLTGVNLPMLLKAVQLRREGLLAEVAEAVGDSGRKSITVAGELLAGSPAKAAEA